MALKGILIGNVLIRFEETLFTETPSNENGIQSSKIVKNSTGQLQLEAFSGGLCRIDKATWNTPTTSGVITTIVLT